MQKDTSASDVTWYLAFLSLIIICAKSLFYTKLSQPGSKLRRQWATTNVWLSNVGDPEIFPFFLNFQNGADDGQCRQCRWSSSLHSQRRPCKHYRSLICCLLSKFQQGRLRTWVPFQRCKCCVSCVELRRVVSVASRCVHIACHGNVTAPKILACSQNTN